MTSFHLRVAIANRSLHLVHDHRHLIKPRHRRQHIARSSRAPARLGLRSTGPAAPSAALPPIQPLSALAANYHHHHHRHHRRRSSSSKLHLLQKHLEMASQHEIRRRSSAADRAPYDTPLSPTSTMAMSTTFSPTPDTALAQAKDDEISRQHLQQHNHNHSRQLSSTSKQDVAHGDAMPPPPRPFADLPAGRRFTHARAHSMASAVPRQANRLSLTLPIAPASRIEQTPARPPSSGGPPALLSSKPPTPAQTPVLPALEDASDFIIAIAAQERRVLELREELARAEADLSSLKAQWSSKESMQKRAVEIQSQSLASPQGCPTPDAIMSPNRHSVDLDRKKMWLQSQQSTPTTPTQGRRKVMRGGHARTLSLLSPVRSDASLNLDRDKPSIDGTISCQPLHERMVPPAAAAPSAHALAKRATWQPRTQPPPSGGVFPLVEDFKLGLRAFVEDIRQITVGDEPITGLSAQRHPAPAALHTRTLSTASSARDSTPSGHERKSSASASARSRPSSMLDASKPRAVLGSKAEDVISMPEKTKSSSKGKQFSWTPLGFETLEDNDWTNWESPTSAKSSRWSGSTIHNGGLDDIEPIPEKKEEATTPL